MFRPLRYFLRLLLPFGIVHLGLIILRNKLYDWGIFREKRLPKPVISVGNIQMGGTRKTPMAIALLTNLQNKGVKVGVLSRGYKRNSGEEMIIVKPGSENRQESWESIGDEPALILENITNGVMGIGADRWRVGKKMLEENALDLFLMDDGLQHRKLHRDLDICLIDVTRWRPHPFLYPLSYLRDCKSSLKRCHAVVLTKSGNDPAKAEKLADEIRDKYQIPVFEGELEPQAFIRIRDGMEIGVAELTGKKVAAFCGIANPDNFFAMLNQIGMELVSQKKYRDHHNYTRDDLNYLVGIIKEVGVEAVITTEKDAVKLKELVGSDPFNGVEFYFLRVKFDIREEREFFEFIQRSVPPKSFN